MRAHPTSIQRAGRLLVAIITVWSLGCVGFEPVLAALFASTEGTSMTCASELGNSRAPVLHESGASNLDGTAVAAVTQGDESCDCTITCLTTVHVPLVLSSPSGPAAGVAPRVDRAPASPSRAPLLPPPERIRV